ncbi:hypothetical protein GCM10010211_16240 [Streptomyces albospinus]|uniref:Uncharacterized protein n=1 Tax=Streptomyces albospinus TaxID=285515 RepID=A0ABQ2UT93_9ACTN|nr:hypothetical protein GCM10010211_16240 [Streptomyces albospinus]
MKITAADGVLPSHPVIRPACQVPRPAGVFTLQKAADVPQGVRIRYGSGADQGDEVGRVHGPPAVLGGLES